jgi:hypothetical protein
MFEAMGIVTIDGGMIVGILLVYTISFLFQKDKNSSRRKFPYSRVIVYFTAIALAAFIISAVLAVLSNTLTEFTNPFLEVAQWLIVIGFLALLGAVFSISKVAITLTAVGHTILRLMRYGSNKK